MNNLPTQPAKITFTYDEAVALLDRFVAEKGADYVYPRFGADCVYFESDKSDVCKMVPSCIVGHAIAAKGMTFATLMERDIDGHNAFRLFDRNHSDLFEADARTVALFQIAQSHQDSGVTWGTSVQIAKDRTADPHADYSDPSRFHA